MQPKEGLTPFRLRAMTRVACHQLAPVIGDLAGNRVRALAAIDAAAAAGAQVVVLPELAVSGYVFNDAAEARTLAEPAGTSPTLAGWAERAAAHDLVIVGGFAEDGLDGQLYNSAAVVDASGVRAVYRKVHLWDREPEAFTPGHEPPLVLDTPQGRIGVMVCYDLEFPEWVRMAALQGAELLCVPTNWPRDPRPAGERPMEVLRAMASAATNRMAVATCDRCGTERGVEWVAGTSIAGPDGWLLAAPPADPEPALILADVDLAAARDKSYGARNDALADRRPSLYLSSWRSRPPPSGLRSPARPVDRLSAPHSASFFPPARGPRDPVRVQPQRRAGGRRGRRPRGTPHRRGGRRGGRDRLPARRHDGLRRDPLVAAARTPGMRVTITGATGRVGEQLVAALTARGDDVTVLSRSPDRAAAALGVEAVGWQPEQEPAPVEALAGRDAVVHLAGEDVAQRWNDETKRRLLSSRELGTRHLVAGLRAAEPRPAALVSSSAVGYYGPRGDERVGEDAPPGDDFLAGVCVAWEREAAAAEALGVRVVRVRTGVVLDKGGGALQKMLPFFKLGVGGPVAGGRQYLPWIHVDDLVALYLAALDDAAWTGAVNGTAPEPVTNAAFSKALGRALHRPAFAPVPGFAVRVLYGEMAEIVVHGQRAVPERTLALGFRHRHPDLDEALRSALAG